MQVLFLLAFFVGFILLILCALKTASVYDSQQEFSAKKQNFECDLIKIGVYEIDVRRRSFFGVIPFNIPFKIFYKKTNLSVPLIMRINFFGQRRGTEGRILPIAEFSIQETGVYRIINPCPDKFDQKDSLIIMPKVGLKMFFLIFYFLFSGIFFIGGLILFVVSVEGNF